MVTNSRRPFLLDRHYNFKNYERQTSKSFKIHLNKEKKHNIYRL